MNRQARKRASRRALLTLITAVLALLAAPTLAGAQKRCVKGKPCGDTCIARNKTCRIGTGLAVQAKPRTRTETAISVSEGTQFVAGSHGRVYYRTRCSAWQSLSPANLRFSSTREAAEAAGYTPSRSRGCAGPATVRVMPRTPAGTSELARPAGPLVGTRTIERVVDGDTVECDEDERVRLLLIDAPEMDQGDYGPRAKTMLETLLPTGTVTTVELDVQERDRYGRVLGYVYMPDDAMANEALVRAGYAVVSVNPPSVRHVERMRAAETTARENRVGLCSSSAFECLPADHRAGLCQ